MPFDAAIAKVTEVLKQEGFGVRSEMIEADPDIGTGVRALLQKACTSLKE